MKQSIPKHTHTAHIKFGAVGEGPSGERFVVVKLDIGQAKPRQKLLRYDDFGSVSRQRIASLNREDAHLINSAAINEFLNRLQKLARKKPTIKVATRVGPMEGAFVLPDKVIYANGVKATRCFDENLTDYLSWGRCGGTIEGWQELAQLAEGNSRLILAFGVAFVGPLQLIVPVEPVAFQLLGPGGTGKSSIGVVASSVWGQRLQGQQPHQLGGGEAWNQTVANLEKVLASRNGTFLFLDEIHLAKPQDVVDAIFLVSEGQGRGRYNEVERWNWFAPVLSTSNVSVEELLKRIREKPDRAAFDRLIDILMPISGFGAFEDLHGNESVGEFVRRLKAISDQNFGLAGRLYVSKICEELADDREKLEKYVRKRRRYFMRMARKRLTNDTVFERVTGHFATVYAALRLANFFKVFRLDKDSVLDALLRCLESHLKATSSLGAARASSPLDLLKTYIKGNRQAFIDLSQEKLPKGHKSTGCPGYVFQESGREWFALSNSAVERIVGGRSAMSELRRDLDHLGLIKKTGGGKGGSRFVSKIQIGPERQYMVCLDQRVLETN